MSGNETVPENLTCPQAELVRGWPGQGWQKRHLGPVAIMFSSQNIVESKSMANEDKLRAWRYHRQGLDGTAAGRRPSEVLQRAGWARSVGGVGPYLTLFSRGGIGRLAVDESVAKLEILEIPAARGCTYVVPSTDFALALKVGQGFSDESKTAHKLGVTDAEIDKLCQAVVAALEQSALEPDELRQAVGGAVRNLGPEGTKKGLTTTLPVALGRLQADGEIRRIPTNGRLDQQRYRYTVWRPNPLAKFTLTAEECYAELARRYFHWIGPATLAEFRWFSGLGVTAAKAAIQGLPLKPVTEGSDLLMFANEFERFEAFQRLSAPRYRLLSSLDSIILLRRDLKGLVAPEDLKQSVSVDKGFQELGTLADFPSHVIMDRGRVVGLWEYDPEAQSVVWWAFHKKDSAVKDAADQMEAYIRSELGDARSFSLDSPKSRAPRIEALRSAGHK